MASGLTLPAQTLDARVVCAGAAGQASRMVGVPGLDGKREGEPSGSAAGPGSRREPVHAAGSA